MKKFINSLSPVKKRIATYLSQGLTPELVAKKIAKENDSNLSTIKAYVTMVVELAKAKKVELAKKEKPISNKKVCDKETKVPYSFDPKKNKGKIKVHNRLIEEVLDSKIKSGLVLTLSWIKCIVETELNKTLKGLEFLSCEKDENTFNLLRSEIKARKLKFMNSPIMCEIGQIIRVSGKDTFAHLFLDYCGRYNSFKEEITIAIERKIVQVDGVIWVTLSRPYETGTLERLKALVKKAGGDDYKIEFAWDYRDGMGMSTVIIRRIK